MIGVDVGDDLVGSFVPQPVDESARRFRGKTLALPLGSDNPRNVGPPSALARGEGCLHGSDRLPVGAAADDPVEPGLVWPRQADEPLVVRTQFVDRGGTTARVLVEALIVQHDRHLVGVLDAQRDETQALGCDGAYVD